MAPLDSTTRARRNLRVLAASARPGAASLVVSVAIVASAATVADTRIDAIVAEKIAADGRSTTTLRDDSWLAQVYSPAQPGPVWFTRDAPRPALTVALRELRSASDRGLTLEDYDVAALERAVRSATAADSRPEVVANADVAVTTAMLRFLSDLHFGRVSPREVAPHYRTSAKDARFVAELRGAAGSDRLVALIDAAEPAFPVYARLKQTLAHYRKLAAKPAPALPPLDSGQSKVVVNDMYTGAPALHDLLIRLGDLPTDTQRSAESRFTTDLAAAVKRFQSRHGLPPDGVLGKQTLGALNVPLAERVTQIELSLERLRWLPVLQQGPAIAINIPSFQLWAFADTADTRMATLSMPVIVGQAVRTETPIFIGEIRAVEFSPYWNVPRNILSHEILPRLARDPTYLHREDMEMVSTRGDGRVLASVDAESIEGLRAGEFRLRQRPGPKNAMGGVKFAIPNAMEIFLHGTPARELFERTRRDFSHGCIRVRDPQALAAFVLGRNPEWSSDAIKAAIKAGKSKTASLAAPIPVIVFYTTAIVDSSGRAIFLADVYGHDRKLLDQLRRSRLQQQVR